MGTMDDFIVPLRLKMADLKLDYTAVLWTLTGLLTSWYTTTVFLQWWKLRHIPGPFLNSITPFVCTYHAWKEDISTYTYNQCRKYGPLVRIAPNVVVFSDPDTFRHVCSYKAKYTRGLWFEFARWDLDHYSCLSMRDNESRKERKAKLTTAWSGKSLVLMEKRVDSQVRSFIDLVQRKYLSTRGDCRPMEFGHRAMMFTLDVATNITFGEAWGFMKTDGDVEKYIETSDAMVPLMGIFGSIPWLVHVIHTWPFKLVMPAEGDNIGFGRLMRFAGEKVKQRLQPQPSSPTSASADPDSASEDDLIRAYLRSGISPEDTVQECITLIAAGTETTSVALKFTLLCLLTTPSAYAKVQAEIDGYFSSNPSTNPNSDTSIVPYSATKHHFPYLTACIREALRLWPPPVGLFTKQVPDHTGDTLHGYYLPPGTEVGQCMTGVGRDKEVFGGGGGDADIFRPERWFEAEPGRLEQMVMAVELVFSSGKYACLGRHVAVMELGKFFVEVLRRYNIAIMDNVRPLRLRDPVTWLAYDFNIRFTERELKY